MANALSFTDQIKVTAAKICKGWQAGKEEAAESILTLEQRCFCSDQGYLWPSSGWPSACIKDHWEAHQARLARIRANKLQSP